MGLGIGETRVGKHLFYQEGEGESIELYSSFV